MRLSELETLKALRASLEAKWADNQRAIQALQVLSRQLLDQISDIEVDIEIAEENEAQQEEWERRENARNDQGDFERKQEQEDEHARCEVPA